MVARIVYDVMYRFGAPWEGPARSELVSLVESGRLTPQTLPPGRAADLGCGSGANAIFLADHGFDVTGVDFSPVALRKAEAAAQNVPGRRVRFVRADLTGDAIAGVPGPFDLVVDYGTLDDLRGADRRAMAENVKRVVRPGGVFLLWCFYGPFDDLPFFRLRGQSRLTGGIEAGEEQALFADAFTIERQPTPAPGSAAACFVMTRK